MYCRDLSTISHELSIRLALAIKKNAAYARNASEYIAAVAARNEPRGGELAPSVAVLSVSEIGEAATVSPLRR